MDRHLPGRSAPRRRFAGRSFFCLAERLEQVAVTTQATAPYSEFLAIEVVPLVGSERIVIEVNAGVLVRVVERAEVGEVRRFDAGRRNPQERRRPGRIEVPCRPRRVWSEQRSPSARSRALWSLTRWSLTKWSRPQRVRPDRPRWQGFGVAVVTVAGTAWPVAVVVRPNARGPNASRDDLNGERADPSRP